MSSLIRPGPFPPRRLHSVELNVRFASASRERAAYQSHLADDQTARVKWNGVCGQLAVDLWMGELTLHADVDDSPLPSASPQERAHQPRTSSPSPACGQLQEPW